MPEPRLRKGDLVKFRLGTRSVHGEVKEDRGPIGIKGRRLYFVEFHPSPQSVELSEIELPADELQSVQEPVSME